MNHIHLKFSWISLYLVAWFRNTHKCILRPYNRDLFSRAQEIQNHHQRESTCQTPNGVVMLSSSIPIPIPELVVSFDTEYRSNTNVINMISLSLCGIYLVVGMQFQKFAAATWSVFKCFLRLLLLKFVTQVSRHFTWWIFHCDKLK